MTRASLFRRIGAVIVVAGALAVALPDATAIAQPHHKRVARCIRGCERQLRRCIRTSHTGPERGACARENQICQRECRGELR